MANSKPYCSHRRTIPTCPCATTLSPRSSSFLPIVLSRLSCPCHRLRAPKLTALINTRYISRESRSSHQTSKGHAPVVERLTSLYCGYPGWTVSSRGYAVRLAPYPSFCALRSALHMILSQRVSRLAVKVWALLPRLTMLQSMLLGLVSAVHKTLALCLSIQCSRYKLSSKTLKDTVVRCERSDKDNVDTRLIHDLSCPQKGAVSFEYKRCWYHGYAQEGKKH